MLFPKPNMKYSDMAIFVDEKVNSSEQPSEHDLELIFIYLYHLTRMLAYKNHYFNKTEYYDDFSIMMASDMMNRLIYNPKLRQLDEFGNPKMDKVKSCLNYLKTILYGRKVLFEQQNYSQKLSNKDLQIPITEYAFDNQIRENRHRQIDSDVKLYMGALGKTVMRFIDDECIYSDKLIRKNIRISCCLSLLNSIVFTQEVFDNINIKYKTPEAKFNYLCTEYETNRLENIILYHLDESYRNYVTVLVRKVFALIENDIKELSIGDTYVSDNVLYDIALAELDGTYNYDD